MSVETEIRIRSEAMAGDLRAVEQKVDEFKSRLATRELKLNVVLDEKRVQQQLERLLTDLQKRADAKPIVIPTQVRDATGAPGGAGGGLGRIGGLGRVGVAYGITRLATAAIGGAADYMDERAAARAGDIDREMKAIEARRNLLTSVPLAGQLGGAVNRLLITGPEQQKIDEVKREAEAQNEIVKIMERRNQLMRQSVEHAKDLTRQAEKEKEERDRPGSGGLIRARDALSKFNEDLETRVRSTGRGPTSEELAARRAMEGNVQEAGTALSRKEIEKGAESLEKWRKEVERFNAEADKAAETERRRREGIADARFGANQARLRASGQGDDADIAEIGRSFDKRIAAAKDYDTQQALTEEKNARLQEEYGKQQANRTRAVADEWERAADAADAAAKNILDTQSMQSDVDELTARNKGQGAVGDFIRLRQHVRDIYAQAGDDPAKQDLARQMGLGLIEQFTKGRGGKGGMFAGGIEFGRSVQQSILGDSDGSRGMAIDLAKAFGAELKQGGNPFGQAAKDISDAAKAFQKAAENMQPIGVISRY
jgi:hypothetical protein